ncbi:hypothetical protein V8F33_000138 [Rhypophila sp. PSN 637]
MTVVAMRRLLAISYVSLTSLHVSSASVLFDGRYAGGLGSANVHDPAGFSFVEPLAGYEAFVGLWPRPSLKISKRECLENGSNYCFGDNFNFCSDCGTCCVEGLYCCGKGSTCCGTGSCCDPGLICSRYGKCLVPVNMVTAISTIYETSTYTNQKRATVVVVEVETSTILSTVETTISNAATQTDVHWVTATVTATPSPQAAALKRADGDGQVSEEMSLLDSLILRGAEFIRNGAVLYQRQAVSVSLASPSQTVTVPTAISPTRATPTAIAPTKATPIAPVPTAIAPAAAAIESTVIKLTTLISTVTKLDVKSVTVTTTSHVMTTIYETVTKVLNAQTTVIVTSTLTVTSHPPVTHVITTTVEPVIPVTAFTVPTESSSASGGSPASLSTASIVGIAVGSAAAFIILCLIFFLIRRRRMREDALDSSDVDSYKPATPQHMLSRQPTLPNLFPPSNPLNHFDTSLPASHHAETAYLPPGYPSPSPSQAFAPDRNSSGFTTLIGQNLAGLKPGDRGSAYSTTSASTFEKLPPVRAFSPFEIPGTQGRKWFEMDGKPVTATPSPFPDLDLEPFPPRPQPHRQGESFYASRGPGQITEQDMDALAELPMPVDRTGDEIGNGNILARGHGQELLQSQEIQGRAFTLQPWQSAPELHQPDEGLYVELGDGGDNRPVGQEQQQHEQSPMLHQGEHEQNQGQAGQQQQEEEEEVRHAEQNGYNDSGQPHSHHPASLSPGHLQQNQGQRQGQAHDQEQQRQLFNLQEPYYFPG